MTVINHDSVDNGGDAADHHDNGGDDAHDDATSHMSHAAFLQPHCGSLQLPQHTFYSQAARHALMVTLF